MALVAVACGDTTGPVLDPPAVVRPPDGGDPVRALRVGGDGRTLLGADGAPFFWMADARGGLLDGPRADLLAYLSRRRAIGFTVVKTALLAGRDPAAVRNAEGDPLFDGGDPSRPGEAYFRRADAALDDARNLGFGAIVLVVDVASLPAAARRSFPAWLAARWRSRTEVLFWVSGDDDAADRPALEGLAAGLTGLALRADDAHPAWRGLLAGAERDPDGRHWQAAWSSFNTVSDVGAVRAAHASTPTKPAVWGLGAPPTDAAAVRRAAHLTLLRGGHFGSGVATASGPDPLDEATAAALRAFTELWTGRRWWRLQPIDDAGLRADMAAARSADGDAAYVFFGGAAAAELPLPALIPTARARVQWLDTATGTLVAGPDVDARARLRLAPPPGWSEALLILEALP